MTVKFTESGLWIEQGKNVYRIGLSEKGQDDVGEIMFVDLPDFSDTVSKGDSLFSIEGAKSVSEIAAPLGGTIETVHQEIEDDPDLLNSTELSNNWIIELSGVDEKQFQELNNDAWETDEES